MLTFAENLDTSKFGVILVFCFIFYFDLSFTFLLLRRDLFRLKKLEGVPVFQTYSLFLLHRSHKHEIYIYQNVKVLCSLSHFLSAHFPFMRAKLKYLSCVHDQIAEDFA